MFSTLVRRAAAPPQLSSHLNNANKKLPAGIYSSRYKPKKVWPPDFSKLSHQEKFRLERRYKRRIKLATARPRWDKAVKIAQLLSVSGVLIYSVLFMDWKSDPQPFQGIRDKFWGAMDAFSPENRYDRRKTD